MKNTTKSSVTKIGNHMKNASNGIPSNRILQSLDKNKFVIEKQISESKNFDDNEIKPKNLFASHNKLINYCNSIKKNSKKNLKIYKSVVGILRNLKTENLVIYIKIKLTNKTIPNVSNSRWKSQEMPLLKQAIYWPIKIIN